MLGLWFQATFTWSGTMSKKKGQKWGMNNSNKRIADIGNFGEIVGSNTEDKHLMVNSKDEENGFCRVSNQKVNGSNQKVNGSNHAEEGKSTSEPLDFDRLYPLTRLPKVIVFLSE
jgi:coilin